MSDQVLNTVYYVLLLAALIFLSRGRLKGLFKSRYQQALKRRTQSMPDYCESLKQAIIDIPAFTSQYDKMEHIFIFTAILREIINEFEDKNIALPVEKFHDTYHQYIYTNLATSFPEPINESLADRFAMFSDRKIVAPDFYQSYNYQDPMGKPLIKQIEYWGDMIQRILSEQLENQLKENNNIDIASETLGLNAAEIHQWLDECLYTLAESSRLILSVSPYSSTTIINNNKE